MSAINQLHTIDQFEKTFSNAKDTLLDPELIKTIYDRDITLNDLNLIIKSFDEIKSTESLQEELTKLVQDEIQDSFLLQLISDIISIMSELLDPEDKDTPPSWSCPYIDMIIDQIEEATDTEISFKLFILLELTREINASIRI